MNQSSIQQHFSFIKPGEKKYRIEPSGDLKKTLKKDLKIPSSKIKSLLTPIPLIPSLSCSTQELINSLQVEKNKNQRRIHPNKPSCQRKIRRAFITIAQFSFAVSLQKTSNFIRIRRQGFKLFKLN